MSKLQSAPQLVTENKIQHSIIWAPIAANYTGFCKSGGPVKEQKLTLKEDKLAVENLYQISAILI